MMGSGDEGEGDNGLWCRCELLLFFLMRFVW